MTTFVPTNQEIGEYDNEQALQHLQGGAGKCNYVSFYLALGGHITIEIDKSSQI